MKRTDVVSMRSLLSGRARYRPIISHRGFVWGPAEVAQLLVDLELAAKADQEGDDEESSTPAERFYLGVMTVNRFRGGQFIVLDGQQRLTTLALILAFARDRIDDVGDRQRLDRMLVRRSLTKSPEPRIRLSPEDHAWFSHFILPPGATRRLPANAPIGSPRGLLTAARFMEQAFLSYSQDDLWTIANYVRRHAAFVRTVTDSVAWTPRGSTPRALPAPPPPARLPAPQPAVMARSQESLHAQYERRSKHAQLFGIAAE
jgi:hypothetical protein